MMDEEESVVGVGVVDVAEDEDKEGRRNTNGSGTVT